MRRENSIVEWQLTNTDRLIEIENATAITEVAGSGRSCPWMAGRGTG